MSDMHNFKNQPICVDKDFTNFVHEAFIPMRLIDFCKQTGVGRLEWQKYRWSTEWAFGTISQKLVRGEGKEVCQDDYAIDLVERIGIDVVSQSVFICRFFVEPNQSVKTSLMVPNPPISSYVQFTEENLKLLWRAPKAQMEMIQEPWQISLLNAEGEVLTSSIAGEKYQGFHQKHIPTMQLRRSTDYSRATSISLSLRPGEKIFGCGESFTRLDKRGQKLNLFCTDVQSAQTANMYKPVPFFMSSEGYGVFVHSSAPMSFDFGHDCADVTTLYVEDCHFDIYFFVGSPGEILSEYTKLTGRSPMPPDWSFGLWMSRLSYQSQAEVLKVTSTLRQQQIPCDVIHLDAGWFSIGWNCDFRFARRFDAPKSMVQTLNKNGYKLSLWQLPYLTPNNPRYEEVIDLSLAVKTANSVSGDGDLVLDFSNPDTLAWYEAQIQQLLDIGVSVIKADFGEAAPLAGSYSSQQSGLLEHNLYPLRYQDALWQVVLKHRSDDALIWARAGWAGAQRYPVHWGGDPEVNWQAMANTLAAGLSAGLSGFCFWSHDIGGFSGEPEPELMLNWAFMGAFTSHSRVHGLPPREPWHFGEPFCEMFRKIIQTRYTLMPYILHQARISSSQGIPMMRPMFLHDPTDPTCWLIQDQYLFGEKLLVAPLFAPGKQARQVYLPGGDWFDYFSGICFKGPGWFSITDSGICGILMVKGDSALPIVPVAQNVEDIDWQKLSFRIYSEIKEVLSAGTYTSDGMVSFTLRRDGERDWNVSGRNGITPQCLQIN